MRLTQREVEMLQLLCEGLRNGQIATRLGIEEGTVKETLRKAYRKMGVANRQDARAAFVREWDEFGRYLVPAEPQNSALTPKAGVTDQPPGRYRPPGTGVFNAVTVQGTIALLTLGAVGVASALAWALAKLL
jgi:DNA-binding CsgD family transcriptional regulator